MKVGVIDLGSNTFHLLVSEISAETFKTIHRQRIFVGLAEGGIASIRPAAIERAKEAIHTLAKSIHSLDINQLKIIGTAALRSAKNAYIINDIVKDALGAEIETISGTREAELIYKGIKLLAGIDTGSHLIMDIGGGSTEFIIVENGQLAWSHSFNIGVAVLHELFHKTEPIAADDISSMITFLEKELQPLKEQLTTVKLHSLIGASGSFEVLATMSDEPVSMDRLQTFGRESFEILEHQIVGADYADRAKLKGMPTSRVKLIVVAFLLIRQVLELTECDCISISPYALKEGLIAEAMEG